MIQCFLGIDIAVEYAQLALEVDKNDSSEIWKELLPAYGYDYGKGNMIFKLCRDDLLAKDSKSVLQFNLLSFLSLFNDFHYLFLDPLNVWNQ